MVTRRDVARLAGTSEAVVSYVLNDGPRGVAPATKERVLAAIAQLGYRPNAVARSLRMQRTMTFGLVVPDNSNPFFAELARSIEDVGFEHGYTMLLGNAMDDDERETSYVRTLLDRQVDGLMIVPSHGSGSWMAELARMSVPMLVLDRRLDLPDTTQVLVDGESGSYQATAHLLEHGRTRIGCIAGESGLNPTVDRVAGWRRALADAGVDADAMPLRHVPFGRAHGYQAGRGMLAEREVDAVFVTCDEQAVGVLRAAADLGVRIPDDVAVFSFDGIEPDAYTVPSLSTMRQPFEEIGRTAVEWLVARVRDRDLPAERIVLRTTMIARGSCGCTQETGDADARNRSYR